MRKGIVFLWKLSLFGGMRRSPGQFAFFQFLHESGRRPGSPRPGPCGVEASSRTTQRPSLRGGRGGGAGGGRTPHPSSALRETADDAFPSREGRRRSHVGMAPYAGRRGRHPLRGGQGGGAGEGRTPHPSSALRETADATFPSRGRLENGADGSLARDGQKAAKGRPYEKSTRKTAVFRVLFDKPYLA